MGVPVTDVIIDLLPERLATLVVAVEIHVKSIDRAVAVVRDHDHGRCGAFRLALRIGSDALKPVGKGGNVVLACEPNLSTTQVVQITEVVERQR